MSPQSSARPLRKAAARRWLSIREAAEYTGFSTRGIRQHIANGNLRQPRVADRHARPGGLADRRGPGAVSAPRQRQGRRGRAMTRPRAGPATTEAAPAQSRLPDSRAAKPGQSAPRLPGGLDRARAPKSGA